MCIRHQMVEAVRADFHSVDARVGVHDEVFQAVEFGRFRKDLKNKKQLLAKKARSFVHLTKRCIVRSSINGTVFKI